MPLYPGVPVSRRVITGAWREGGQQGGDLFEQPVIGRAENERSGNNRRL